MLLSGSTARPPLVTNLSGDIVKQRCAAGAVRVAALSLVDVPDCLLLVHCNEYYLGDSYVLASELLTI